MGKHKDKIGKSRAGVFLEGLGEVGKPILKAAASYTGIEALDVLSDSITTSRQITQEQKEKALDLIKIDMEEVTKRWEIDSKSDSILTKNIRPLVLLWLVVFMSAIIISDSNEGWRFDVKESYISLIEVLLVTVIVAYFGGRSYEKIKR
jgi:hypothetical protein